MLLTIKSKRLEIPPSIDLRHPHLEVAFEQHRASPSGIAREECGQQWSPAEQEQEPQRIPLEKIRTLIVMKKNLRSTYQASVTNKLSRQPQERLLEVVIGLG